MNVEKKIKLWNILTSNLLFNWIVIWNENFRIGG
jgi:hypothetical protein